MGDRPLSASPTCPDGRPGKSFRELFGTTTLRHAHSKPGQAMATRSSTQLTTPNNYALDRQRAVAQGQARLDLRHDLPVAGDQQREPCDFTGVSSLAFNAYSHSQLLGNVAQRRSTGYSYASYLLGAVGGSTSNDTTALDRPATTSANCGGRYKPIVALCQDSYKVTEADARSRTALGLSAALS